MTHRDLPADADYGPRIYAARDRTLEIYDPEAARAPSLLLVFGVTAMAAALVMSARRRAQPFSVAGPARPHRDLLSTVDDRIHILSDALTQAQTVLTGMGRAASEIRQAVSEAKGRVG